MLKDLGAELYQTWSDEQRREEIAKLVTGYRNGIPIDILCRMAVAIAGTTDSAAKYLADLMPLAERQQAVASAPALLKAQIKLILLA